MNTDSISLLEYEHGLRAAGYRCIAGIDEVGRGALAGPIAAGVVVLPEDMASQESLWSAVRDSKTLTPKRRTILADGICDHARAFQVAMVDVATIDQIGIAAANRLAMDRALEQLSAQLSPDFLLIDAMTIDSELPQIGIIDGDAISLSIAAASIVAKVSRDSYMERIAIEWPQYEWARNKGYGVAAHLSALRESGPCIHHRTSFRPVAACASHRHE